MSCHSRGKFRNNSRLLFRFPGQQKVGGDSKIPSVVCYDENGLVVAVGSETDEDTNPELLEVDGLVRAEWCAPSHYRLPFF